MLPWYEAPQDSLTTQAALRRPIEDDDKEALRETARARDEGMRTRRREASRKTFPISVFPLISFRDEALCICIWLRAMIVALGGTFQ